PPPSNFNRRVTPELDAISLRAVARDVADRYQTAAQFAADLDALIAGYRFDPKELRQFVRQLFRKEYAIELEETQQALDAEPGMAGYMQRLSSSQIETPTEPRIEIAGNIAEPSEVLAAQPEGSDEGGDDQDPNKPRGFWGSL